MLKAQLLDAIENPSRTGFCLAFAECQDVLGLTDLELAKTFQISKPTVGRWYRGESAPHSVGFALILNALLRRVNDKIAEVRSSALKEQDELEAGIKAISNEISRLEQELADDQIECKECGKNSCPYPHVTQKDIDEALGNPTECPECGVYSNEIEKAETELKEAKSQISNANDLLKECYCYQNRLPTDFVYKLRHYFVFYKVDV